MKLYTIQYKKLFYNHIGIPDTCWSREPIARCIYSSRGIAENKIKELESEERVKIFEDRFGYKPTHIESGEKLTVCELNITWEGDQAECVLGGVIT